MNGDKKAVCLLVHAQLRNYGTDVREIFYRIAVRSEQDIVYN